MKGNCKDCEFYQAETDVPASTCRRRAPTWVHAPEYEDDSMDGWPVVDPDDWCGEFEQRAPEGHCVGCAFFMSFGGIPPLSGNCALRVALHEDQSVGDAEREVCADFRAKKEAP